MPPRDDLILSDEQKMYIELRHKNNQRLNYERQQLERVAQTCLQNIQGLRHQNYRRALQTGVQLWKNYLISMEKLNSSLVNQQTISAAIEMLKILPTRDNEFYELGDMLFVLK